VGTSETPDLLDSERNELTQALPAYEIVGVIGRGAFAVVYSARHVHLGREVAIKRLSPELLRDGEARDRFAAEARLLASLDHPHVVRVYDYVERDQLCALVMERMHGGTLADRMRLGPVKLPRACAIALAALHGLEHAHRHGVLHRDVKPENLLFGDHDLVKVADFGIAKVIGAQGARLTATARSIGTPAFMAPEQVSRSAGPLGPATDVWAIGALLYELLAGVPPFAGDELVGEVLLRHLSEDPAPLESVAPHLPSELATAVMRALQRDPSKRFATAGAFAAALEPAANAASGPGGLAATGIPIHRSEPGSSQRAEATLVAGPSLAERASARPYRGLFAFREQDAEYFFGREAVVEELEAAVSSRAFTAVVGASGSGKSSLVLAGLVPRLRSRGYWEVAHFRPGQSPLHGVAGALVPLLERDASETERLVEADKLAEALRTGRVTLESVAARICEKTGVSRVLVFADQFEELYTLAEADDRDQLLDQLLRAVAGGGGQDRRLTVLVTLRADFLGHAISHRALADALQHSDLKLGPMNRDELRAVIAKPANRTGATLEHGLTERMLDAVGEEPGDLPLLEFALTQLWEWREGALLTHEAYDRMGGVEQALARYADDVFEGLSPAEQEAAHTVLVQLVQPGEGTAHTRRIATRAEVGEANWALVGRLATARLVVTGRPEADGEETVELVHEALITRWGRMREWMEADHAFRAWQERLRAAMRQWEASGRDEGALLRGGPLMEAREWSAGHWRLSGAETAFIDASNAAADALERERSASLRRERRQAQALRVGAGLLAVALVGAVVLAVIAGRDRNEAERQRRIALTQALAAGVDQQVADHQHQRAALLALLAYRFDRETGSTLRADVDRGLRAALDEPAFSRTLRAHEAEVSSVAVSPDGRTIASAGAGGAGGDHSIRLSSIPERGRTLRVLQGHTNAVNAVAYSPDGTRLASAGADRAVLVWDVARPGGTPVRLPGHVDGALSVAWAPGGRSLAAGGGDGSVRLWSPQQPRRPFTVLPGHTDGALSLAYRSDGRALATGDGAGTVRIWDLRRPSAAPRVLRTVDAAVLSVAYAPDGRSLAWTTDAGAATVMDLRSGQVREIRKPTHDLADVYSVTFSRDGRSLAVGDYDTRVDVWSTARLDRPPRVLRGHVGPVRSVAFTPDGRTLVSGSADHTLRVWSLRTPSPVKQAVRVGQGEMSAVAFSRNGRRLATGAQDSIVRVWDARRLGRAPLLLRGHTDEVRSLSFAPGDRFLASSAGGDDPVVRIWDLTRPSAPPRELTGHEDRVLSVEFGPGARLLASASDDKTIRLYRGPANAPRLLKVLRGHAGAVRAVSFSPDGRLLASGGDEVDNTVRVWDLRRLDTPPRVFKAPLDIINVLAFSPDSRTLAVGSDDAIVRLFDVRRRTARPAALEGHSGEIEGLRFLEGGRLLASAGDDHTVRFWDLRQPTQQPIEFETVNEIEALDVSRDGRLTAYTGDEGVLYVERTRTAELAAKVCPLLWRNLTRDEWDRFVGRDIAYRSVCPGLSAAR
jgi:WD40 repeat protein/tRNA A-37 threonylcarbamoyl transferase component Bud32/energy-coupling factor transporter ATP-binding protein EcfA2